MPFRHGKSTAVLVGSNNLSTYFNDASVSRSVDVAETTTYGVTGDAKTFIVGHNDSTINASGLFDGDAGAVDAVLTAAIGSDTEFEVTVANDGGMVVGRRCITGLAINTTYEVSSPIADVVAVSADFQSDAETRAGIILAALGSISSTSDGTAVDNTTSTSNGGIAVLHVTANTRNGSITVKVQHSADNSTWADLATFTTVTSSTKTSERLTVATGTTVNRYLRASYTVAGSTGSATIAVAFARRP